MKYLAIFSIFAIQCFAEQTLPPQTLPPVFIEDPAPVVELPPVTILPIEDPAPVVELPPVTILPIDPIIPAPIIPDPEKKPLENADNNNKNDATAEENIKTVAFVSDDANPEIILNDESKDQDQEYREPTVDEVASILSQTDEIYKKDMDSHGEYYTNISTAKEIFSSSFYQTTLKNIVGKFFQIRADLLEKIIVVCDKYPEVELAQKIKKDTLELSQASTEMPSNIILLMCGVKLSDNNLYSESEFIDNTLESGSKFLIVMDLCDQMKVDDEKLLTAVLEKYLSNIVDICSRSNNEFLNRVSLFVKEEKSLEDFIDKKILSKKFTSLEKFETPFELELKGLMDNFALEVQDFTATFPALFEKFEHKL